MNMIFLSQVSGILKPFAWIIGFLLNLIYEFLNIFGIENVAASIVLLTIVIKIIMTPLTIKQQKSSKLQSIMQPEIAAITEKYKGKKDEYSMRRQQEETNAVYEKYGTSMTAGCLPMLIMLPIMFALYRVIYAVPAYIGDIYEMYKPIAEQLLNIDVVLESFGTAAPASLGSLNGIIDVLKVFNEEKWMALADELRTLSYTGAADAIINNSGEILRVNSFFTLNLLDTPLTNGFFTIALIIPILAAASQMLQSYLSQAAMKSGKPAKQQQDESPMTQSMNSMMKTMPIVSGVMCLMMPICMGMYWSVSSLVTIVQQLIINKILDKTDMDEMIRKNVEKQKKKKEKMGITSNASMNKYVNAQTRSINVDANTSSESEADKNSADVQGAEKGLSYYANALKNRSVEKGDK